MHEKWISSGNVLLILTAALAVACVVAQALLARWWETSGGRHVMAFQSVLAAVLTLWALRVWLPDMTWLVVARGLAFGGLPVVFTWRLLIILKTWREKHRKRAEVAHGDDR
jgi:Na+/pantothenate symporter